MSQIELTLTADHYEEIQQQAREYYAQDCIENPLTLTFDLPSPWNYDISKAPRDGKKLLIEYSDCEDLIPVRWDDYFMDRNQFYYDEKLITAWMEIPALPERI